MARKNESSQKAAMRKMMCDYLKNNDISIKNGTDINSLMHDMMSVLLEGALDKKLSQELSYPIYAKGMITGEIKSHIEELYDMDISNSTISRITDKILPIVKEWHERPLEEIYAVVFKDAIHYHVRSDGIIVKRAVYIELGMT